jgi:hypothetical protein
MPIDFDALVLSVGQNTFGIQIIVLPIKSQPLVASYPARGVLTQQQLSIPMEDGSVMASLIRKLSIRISEFPIVPVQGDKISIGPKMYFIDDSHSGDDGQGATVLILKETRS